MGKVTLFRVILVFFFIATSLDLAQAKDEVVFRRYLPQGIVTLDPLRSIDQNSQAVIRQVYDPLFKLEDGITPKPHLVSSYSYEAKSKIYKFVLRTDVSFHNGKKFGPEDVIYTFRRICKNPTGTVELLQLIKGCRDGSQLAVKKTAPNEVAIELTENYPPFLTGLANPQFMILPENLLGSAEEIYFQHPIGTGAYSFNEKTNNFATITANPKYFLGPPKIDRIEYITENSEKIYDMVTDQTIDDIFPLPPPEKYPSRYEITKTISAKTFFLGFRTQIAPFDDINIRKAIRAALNSEEFIRAAKQDSGVMPAGGVIPWGAIGYDPTISKDNYDPSAVKKYVKSSRYKSIDNVPLLEIHVSVVEPFDKYFPDLLKKQLSSVGFKVKIVSERAPVLIEKVAAGHKIGAVVIALTVVSSDSYKYIEFWRSDFRNPLLAVKDKRLDKILDESLQTSDRVRRAQIYQRANRYMDEMAYTHNFFYLTQSFSLRAKAFQFPNMNLSGPFFFDMFDVRYSNEK